MAEESFQNNFFDTEYLKADLKGRSVRGGALMIGSQGAKFCLNLTSTVILARLLAPEDFGLVAMVAVVAGLVGMFKDFGLSMATIQKKEITHDQVSTLFWINLGLSFLLMLFLGALAPVVVWFYGESRIWWLTFGLASGIVFSGLGIQHEALLRRQMRFRAVAIIDVISMAVGVAMAVVMALFGLGYWALVAMTLSTAAARSTCCFISCGWIPGAPRRHAGVRRMLYFGGTLTLFELMSYTIQSLDKFLIGHLYGAGLLGFYSKAQGLLLMPVGQVTYPLRTVSIPALSALQGDPDRYRRYFLRVTRILSLIIMPIMVFLLFNSKQVILLVLGDQWLQASMVFTVLCVAGLVRPISSAVSWLFISKGRASDMLKWRLVTIWILPVCYIIGIRLWGYMGIAYGFCVSSYINFFIFVLWGVHGTRIRFIEVLATIAKSFVFSLCVQFVVILIVGIDCENIFLSIGAWMFIMVAAFLVILRNEFKVLKALTLGRRE